MALGDSNFDQTLKVNSSGDVIVGGPMVWSGIEGPDKRTLLTVTQAKKMRAKDGTPLPGTPIADVIVRYVLVQGERGSGSGFRTHAGVAFVKAGAKRWEAPPVPKADLKAAKLKPGLARGVGMAVSLNHTGSTPSYETLTWCVQTHIPEL